MNSQETQPLTNNIGRVIRGGSWGYFAWSCRSACRSRSVPVPRFGYLGFRVIKKSQQGNPVIRGGCWINLQVIARADGRYDGLPYLRLDYLGFRVTKQRNTQ